MVRLCVQGSEQKQGSTGFIRSATWRAASCGAGPLKLHLAFLEALKRPSRRPWYSEPGMELLSLLNPVSSCDWQAPPPTPIHP